MAIAWAMQDESDPLVESVLLQVQAGAARVPMIWWYEVRNIIVINERRGRIQPAESDIFLRELLALRIRIDPLDIFDVSNRLPNLARRFSLTVYDAAYFEIALREGLPLATLDKKLQGAAKSVGVTLLTP